MAQRAFLTGAMVGKMAQRATFKDLQDGLFLFFGGGSGAGACGSGGGACVEVVRQDGPESHPTVRW